MISTAIEYLLNPYPFIWELDIIQVSEILYACIGIAMNSLENVMSPYIKYKWENGKRKKRG